MKKCMAANWKMFKTRQEAGQTAAELTALTADSLPSDREVLIFPPFTAISAVAEALGSRPGFGVGAQNFYPADEGAYTGEIAPGMLTDLGCTWALVGHSERRHVFEESNALLAEKTAFGLSKGLNIMLCIGETLDERQQGRLEFVLQEQLQTALSVCPGENLTDRLAVAYEPVWAIGTGEVARNQDIREAHAFVRTQLQELVPNQAESLRILYGGSVKPGNIAEIIGLDNVDGVLVGGASLSAESFSQIVLG
ncbi:MAG: triose-phosphate isomerase [Desulfohalobiaceae bacterium]|nr:triose-phosphate isomerase [Desulfohalobiaceae bacterium]